MSAGTEMAVLEANGQPAQHESVVPVSTAKKLIMVCTPTLGMVSMHWAITVADLVWPMNVSRGILPVMDNIGGEVGEVRNKCVQLALGMEKSGEIEVHSILWLDDDVITNRMIICALARHDVPIASGVYFCKGDLGEPLIFRGPSAGTAPWQPGKILQEWGWAQGLCLIETEVYKRMRDECPEMGVDKYGNPRWYHTPDFAFDKDGYLTTGGTEDFPFFARAAQLGYKPLIDCSKFGFGWHYDHKKKVSYPRVQWEQWQKKQPIVWQTKDGEVVWD